MLCEMLYLGGAPLKRFAWSSIMCPSMKIFYGLLHVFSQKAMKNKKKDFRRNILICFYKFLCVYVLPEPGNRIVKTGILFKSVFDLMLAEQFLANLRLCFLKKYIPHF